MPLRRKGLLGALLVGALIGVAAPPAAPAAAASRVKIYAIYYDSPGVDTGTNASLNAERVVLKNTSRVRVNLHGWSLRDTSRHIYVFTGTYYLRAGRTVVIHTGRGADYGRHRYWDRRFYVWNNTTDTAVLRGPAGGLKDLCTYTGPNDQRAGGAAIAC